MTIGLGLQNGACNVQAVKAAEDAAVHATQAAQQAEAGGSPVDVVAKATLATVRCSQVRTTLNLPPSHVTVVLTTLAASRTNAPAHISHAEGGASWELPRLLRSQVATLLSRVPAMVAAQSPAARVCKAVHCDVG